MMQHRAQLIGGRFQAGPLDGGWCVEVFLPPRLTASSEWT
jgi:hypothetical protein